jgi:cytochrome c553
MRSFVPMLLLLVTPIATAADADAGNARATAVCAACHGASGISVIDTIPNLAGHKRAYLESQLRALKDGSRKNPVMNAIA